MSIEDGGHLHRLKPVYETRPAGTSFTRGPGGGESNSSPRYCTSTLMVWVAVTRA